MNFIPVHPRLNFVTLCAYAQQCYAFGRVGLRAYNIMYIYIYMYVNKKNRLFSALPLENLLLSVMHCLHLKFKCLQCGLLRPAIDMPGTMYRLCASASVSDFQFLCYGSNVVIYTRIIMQRMEFQA